MGIGCNQASTHVWWDLFNPTQVVNKILTDVAWASQPIADLCHPISIHELASIKV